MKKARLKKGGPPKILALCIVSTLCLVLLATSGGGGSPISIYVRNVGCDAKDVQVAVDGKAAGGIVTVENDGAWVDLGEHEFDHELGLRTLAQDGKILRERGLGSAYFDDWNRQVLAVTLLQDEAIYLMKHQPPPSPRS
jgi:hypothetical protein